jgi:hypothetical protein
LAVVLGQIYDFCSGEISLIRCDGCDERGWWRADFARSSVISFPRRDSVSVIPYSASLRIAHSQYGTPCVGHFLTVSDDF